MLGIGEGKQRESFLIINAQLPLPSTQYLEETQLTIRKAQLIDVPGIHRLICHYAAKRILLPRTLTDVYENVWEFTVAEEEGKLVGCGALKLYSQELVEIRSLCVDETLKSQGIGREVAEELLNEAGAIGLKTVFVLTIAPAFFEKLGFRHSPRERFPTKVWHDCLRCERYSCCDEKALSFDLVGRPARLAAPIAEVAEVSI
jgi:amino-acid N-acetyltransferase